MRMFIIVGVIAFICMLVVFIKYYLQYNKIKKYTGKTKGIVKNTYVKNYNTNEGSYNEEKCIIHYQVGRNIYENEFGNNLRKHCGDEVTIIYNEKNPVKSYIEGDKLNQWLVGIMGFVLGVIGIVLVILIISQLG